MNNQQTKSLFDPPVKQKAGTPKQLERSFEKSYNENQPLAHRHDPTSSYAAGDRALKSGRVKGQTQAVLEALREYSGRTSAELADIMNISRYDTARRLPVLARRGFVVRGAERMCRVCRCPCVTWRAIKLV